jgi:hypothetical protein
MATRMTMPMQRKLIRVVLDFSCVSSIELSCILQYFILLVGGVADG